ncbi:hypothetical protein G6O67_008772 [Ophiocordyceps sinensis]|uniref:Uncharacterized protein n=1 Tax=Ophiocordyceps sinensis TaxID=72228 RepID=A0A8H4PIQ5_9HYPO|nr:hypothetical protein G6O67_008772 [Ophiocordyceps sinensis]
MSLWEPAISHFLGASLATPNSDTMSVTAMQSRMVADNPAMMEALSFDLGDLTWMTDVFGPGSKSRILPAILGLERCHPIIVYGLMTMFLPETETAKLVVYQVIVPG